MRRLLAMQLAALLSLSTSAMAATVEYQHPNLTIVATDEPLDSVLKSLGRSMRIYITVPTGLNPMVSCDIQRQPVKQALKKLLGDLSYSLEWEEGGSQLVGLTILAGGGGGAVAATIPEHPVNNEAVNQADVVPVAPVEEQGAAGSVFPIERGAPAAAPDTVIADHDAQMAEHEAQMAAEREAHEAEMELRRQEEEIAHEQRMKEEVERHDAEAAAYLESQGIQLPQ